MKKQSNEAMQNTVKNENSEVEVTETSTTKISKSVTTNKGLEELKALAQKESQAFTDVSGRGSGLISIVSSKDGTRFTISKFANQKLGYPSEIYIGLQDEHIMIFNAEDMDLPAIRIKQEQGKIVIYNKKLVTDIIYKYSLNFTGITSKSFADGYFEVNARPIMYVKMV